MPNVRMEKSKKKKKTSPMEGQAPWSQSRRQCHLGWVPSLPLWFSLLSEDPGQLLP